ncbi:hypothetical protein CWN37_24130 [Klebsiella pneumoniae]|nr:hypothetical protein CWN37_24130 [Klebsiella pneumoniae]
MVTRLTDYNPDNIPNICNFVAKWHNSIAIKWAIVIFTLYRYTMYKACMFKLVKYINLIFTF